MGPDLEVEDEVDIVRERVMKSSDERKRKAGGNRQLWPGTYRYTSSATQRTFCTGNAHPLDTHLLRRSSGPATAGTAGIHGLYHRSQRNRTAQKTGADALGHQNAPSKYKPNRNIVA
jgi:hypothetical protein